MDYIAAAQAAAGLCELLLSTLLKERLLQHFNQRMHHLHHQLDPGRLHMCPRLSQ